MNTGVTITTITLTLLIILPLAYMQMQKKKSNNKILNALKELAQQQNSNITTHEVSGDFAIGIDQNSKRLFFYREKEHENVAQNIDLNTIKNCTILNLKNTNRGSHAIERVGLTFTSNSPKENDSTIELYNHNESYQLNGELDFVNKWSKIIQNIL
ncbi:hypothetical protein [Lacinutrix undariae]